jgi:hypothetical protein
MFIFVLCHPKSQKVPQEDLVLMEIWLLTVSDSEHTNFTCGMIGVYDSHSDIGNSSSAHLLS